MCGDNGQNRNFINQVGYNCAADFQIATSIRLAATLQDLRPFLENRPIYEAAVRTAPVYAGDVPPGLPTEWLAPLRENAAATVSD